jgi:hypothetical protein
MRGALQTTIFDSERTPRMSCTRGREGSGNEGRYGWTKRLEDEIEGLTIIEVHQPSTRSCKQGGGRNSLIGI